MNRRLQERFNETIEASLDEVTNANRQSAVTAPTLIDSWEIPESDRSALRNWGLPVMNENPKSVHFKADFQLNAAPTLKRSDSISYRIGSYHYRDIGIRRGDGLIVGYPQDDRYSRISFINDSGSAFVEIVWRWTAAFKVLCELEDDGEFEQLEEDLNFFYEYTKQIDPATSDYDRFDWWLGVLQGWLPWRVIPLSPPESYNQFKIMRDAGFRITLLILYLPLERDLGQRRALAGQDQFGWAAMIRARWRGDYCGFYGQADRRGI